MPPITFNEAQISAWMAPIFWPFVRLLAIFTSAPVLSSRAVPIRVRIGLAFLVAVLLQPVSGVDKAWGLNHPDALALLTQQVVVGLSIGFAARLVFSIVEFAGELVGLQMGLNFAAFFDPALNSQSSAVARMYTQMAVLLFVVANGPVLLLSAVANSLQHIPVGVDVVQPIAALELYKLGGEIFAAGFWMALPIIGVLLFTNIALGVISRVAPQMNIFAIGFPITLVVGMLAVAVTLPDMAQPFDAIMSKFITLFG